MPVKIETETAYRLNLLATLKPMYHAHGPQMLSQKRKPCFHNMNQAQSFAIEDND